MNWASNPQAGDIFTANGVAGIIVDVDPKGTAAGNGRVTLTTEGTDYSGTDGGGFVYTVNSLAAITITANIVAGTTDCLAISGAGSAGTELTIDGNATGGSVSGAEGIVDTHTGSGAIVAFTGVIRGGSSTISFGFTATSATGTVNLTGNVYPGATSCGLKATSSGMVVTLTGDCIGSDTTESSACYSTGATPLVVVGNIINGSRGCGIQGSIKWNPGTLGTHFRYIKIADATTGSDYAVIPPVVANVKSGEKYGWDGSTYYTGTLSSSGGGGAWGF